MMTNPVSQTIAAISTPPGKGGVALLRVSGPDAFSVVAKCFKPTYGTAPLEERKPRTAIRGDFFYEDELVDDGMVFLYPAPKSYTGENTVELTCHGGVLVTKTILESLLLCGARMAGPGEFTRRAYLNGNLSLTEAEAIGNLLEAGTYSQIRLSERESRTHLSQALTSIHDELLLILSSLYATIDYPEEDLADFSDEELISRLQALLSCVTKLESTYRTGRSIMSGVKTVICGKPNVGKSSLYNALVHEDAAIVTNVAGTTRDVLERTVSVGQVTLHLFDTAGLHETTDAVESIGVERSRSRMQEAELILAVFDGSQPLEQEDLDLLKELRTYSCPVIILKNKMDLYEEPIWDAPNDFSFVLDISAKASFLSALEDLIEKLYIDDTIKIGEDAVITSARQYASLHGAKEILEETIRDIQNKIPADVACTSLEQALGLLEEVDGRQVSEEIVASIFSHFCVGK